MNNLYLSHDLRWVAWLPQVKFLKLSTNFERHCGSKNEGSFMHIPYVISQLLLELVLISSQ